MRPKIYRCHCGRTKEEHADISLEERSIDNTHHVDDIHVEEKAWDPDQYLGRKETNPYGDVVFYTAGSKSRAKVCLIVQVQVKIMFP